MYDFSQDGVEYEPELQLFEDVLHSIKDYVNNEASGNYYRTIAKRLNVKKLTLVQTYLNAFQNSCIVRNWLHPNEFYEKGFTNL